MAVPLYAETSADEMTHRGEEARLTLTLLTCTQPSLYLPLNTYLIYSENSDIEKNKKPRWIK